MGTTLSPDQRYIILVRHASRDFKSNHDESKQSMSGWNPSLESVEPCFKAKGLPRTLAIANRLADELGQVKIGQIWHSPHTVAAETAKGYQWVIQSRTGHDCSADPMPSLDPDAGSPTKVAQSLRVLAKSGKIAAGSAIVLVGHQPMLTLVARALTRGKLPASTLPLAGSEAACLEFRNGEDATLLWMLTEKSSDLMGELKEKIKSKYDVAKFFLGAFVVNTGFVLSGEIWKVSGDLAMWLVFAGFVLTLVALALTAATLMSYDALLMPTEFWTGPSADDRKDRQNPQPKKWSVLRPPSQAHVVLFYEMIHVWTVFFIPALTCAFAAVAAFLIALIHSRLSSGIGGAEVDAVGLFRIVVIAVVAAGALTMPLAFHYRRSQPNLGFED
jgi:phosphohistidine phosphatase SixA